MGKTQIKKFMTGLIFTSVSLLSIVSCKSQKNSKVEALKTETSIKENKMSTEDVLKGKEGVFAVLTTEKGEIVLNLFYKETPMTVTNFVGLAEGTLDAAKGKPFYDGLKFHRVISDFMIQGGDPKGNGTGGPGYKFPDEFVDGLIFDKPGKLAMANSGPNTNGSQFFITHVPTDWLNYKHTIFGDVVSGQDVVDSVAQDDTIISLKIIRQGSEAEKFTATQADFDSLVKANEKKVEEFKKAEAARKEKEMQAVIEGCEKTESGIYFKIMEKGNGTKVGKGKNVTAEYIGYLVDGQPFDASKGFHPQGHEPLEFTTGIGQMIPGFDEMAQDMEYGETRHMVLPPELAYGSRGIPQAGIPGNAYLCFDVKIVK